MSTSTGDQRGREGWREEEQRSYRLLHPCARRVSPSAAPAHAPSMSDPASHTATTPSAIPPTMSPFVEAAVLVELLDARLVTWPHAREEKRVRVLTLRGRERRARNKEEARGREWQFFPPHRRRRAADVWALEALSPRAADAPCDGLARGRCRRHIHGMKHELAAIVIETTASSLLQNRSG